MLFGLCSVIALSHTATSFAATPTDIYATTDKAVSYLSSQQQIDGSIAGADGASDWAVLGVVANGGNPETLQLAGGASLADFVRKEPTPSTTTGIERQLLALSALHADTTTLKATLLTQFDGAQFGDKALLNDDIFGIIAVAATKDVSLYGAAQYSLDYLIAHQDSTTGGFSYCADTTQPYCGVDGNDTAAAIVALQAAAALGLTNTTLQASLKSAVTYLLSTQQADGGFGYDTNNWSTSDSASTGWALMALNSLSDNTIADKVTATSKWLISAQDPSTGSYGYEWNGYNPDTKTTADATLALVGTNWLLDPAAISRPIVPISVPVVTPTPVTPSPAAVVNTPILANISTDDYSAPTTGMVEAATDTIPATNTTAPVASKATTPATDTQNIAKNPDTNNPLRNIGAGLIAVAGIGLVVYVFYIWRGRVN